MRDEPDDSWTIPLEIVVWTVLLVSLVAVLVVALMN